MLHLYEGINKHNQHTWLPRVRHALQIPLNALSTLSPDDLLSPGRTGNVTATDNQKSAFDSCKSIMPLLFTWLMIVLSDFFPLWACTTWFSKGGCSIQGVVAATYIVLLVDLSNVRSAVEEAEVRIGP